MLAVVPTQHEIINFLQLLEKELHYHYELDMTLIS